MAGEDIITMKTKELKQLHVIRKAIEKQITQKDASQILKLTERQIRRKVKRVREEKDRGVIHRSRGKTSNSAKPKETKEKAIRLYRKKYWDFGPTLASEKLFEKDGIEVSRETLRGWLLESGDWKKRNRSGNHRQRRDRKKNFGCMIQADGSHHDWFEKRGPKCVLMGYKDDATGEVFARFYEYEGTVPAMDSFRKYIDRYGIPQSLYMDKHTTYKSNGKLTIEDQLKGRRKPLSQFERAVEELGVRLIHAHSPQAKGRIENLFKTFQDRVIKEMRLEGVSSIEQANEFLEGYLPKYNERFRVLAAKKSDLHRSVPKDMDLDSILCVKEPRTIRKDNTVAFENRLYQVMTKTTGKKVSVQKRLNGQIVITYKGSELKHEEVKNRPPKQREKKQKAVKKKREYKPPMNHPWRKGYPQSYTYPQKEKSSKKEKELLLV